MSKPWHTIVIYVCISKSFPMHITSHPHTNNTHSTVHSNRSTSTSYSTRPLKKARPFKCHSVGHLHIYSSLHTDAHQCLESLAFPPQDPSSIIKKHGGFPLIKQQNEIKRTTEGRGRKCQTCFIQLWKYERRCDLKDERGVHEVRGQKVQAFFRDTYKVREK